MRLLVCGTRQWSGSWEDIAEHLPEDMRAHGVTVIHGACSRKINRRVRGGLVPCEVSVDMIADFVVRRLGFAVEPYPVDHALDGPWPAAGPRRNARMLREGKPTHGLAFGPLVKPGGASLTAGLKTTGTGNMVGLMLAARIPVRWVSAPGAASCEITALPAIPRMPMPAPPRGGA